MLHDIRTRIGRIFSATISKYLSRPLGNHQAPTGSEKHGLAIIIDEVPANFEEKRPGEVRGRHSPIIEWLSATTLIPTTFLFFVLGAALLLVRHYNNLNNGFTLVTNNHYAWTYGPTAVLVLVIAIWRQIDYHFKAATPWTVLYRACASGYQSLLLDYVSPLLPVSFWRAAKNQHYGVLFTICGFVLLKVITLASTALFVEVAVDLPDRSVNLTLGARFNGALWNITQPFGSEDASIAYAAYGALARGVLSQNSSVTESLVYRPANISPQLQDRTKRVITEVDAFIPIFNCGNASVAINPSPYGTDGQQSSDTMAILSPQCQLMGGAQPVFVVDASVELCPSRQFRGNMVRVNCSTTAADETNWQLLTLAEVSYHQVLNKTSRNTSSAGQDSSSQIISSSVAIEQVVSILCRPSYSMGRVNVTYDFTQDPPLITAGTAILSNTSLSGLEDNDLASRFSASLIAGANMFGDLSAQSDLEEDFPNTMFNIMASTTDSTGRYQSLLDGSRMLTAANQTYAQLTNRFAVKYLLEEDLSETFGTAVFYEYRLKMATFSFWIMLTGFALMMALAIIVYLLRPRVITPPDYQTIHGCAVVLSQSFLFRQVVNTLKDIPEKEVAQRLKNYTFSAFTQMTSTTTPTVVIEPQSSEDRSRSADITPNETAATEEQAAWWQPLPIRTWVILLILLLLILTIAALEILQRLSDGNHGVVNLPGANSTMTTVYTRLLPALLMLILAASVNAVDFNITVLAPYNSLSSGAAPVGQSLKSVLIGELPPIGLVKAARNKHFAALFSSTAALIGSLLTILVSGLYTADSFPGIVDHTSLTALDAFNTSWINSATDDGSAALIVSLTESLNTSYPAFTYDELALPSIVRPDILGDLSDMVLQTNYRALRATLNCTTLESSSFNISASFDPRIDTASATVEAIVPLPPHCRFGGEGGNLSYIEVTYRAGFQTNASYFGKVLDLHVGPYDAIEGSAIGESNPAAQPDNPPGCPSLAFVHGYADVQRPEGSSVTVLVCYQQMQSVQTTVAFNLTSMSLTNPHPLPVEATVKLLPASGDGLAAFPYRIQRHIDQSLSMFNQTEFSSANLVEAPVDNFYQAVLFGRKPLPISTLVGNENKAAIFQGINSFYRRYMAQAISNSMRVPVTSEISTPAFNGTVLSSSQNVRLVQHNEAKVALQTLLGIMTVLVALACYLTKLRHLVPYNPCTIFGVMALLAGSRMCRDGRFEQLQVNEDVVQYKLGWWDDQGGTSENSQELRKRRRYGIDAVDLDI